MVGAIMLSAKAVIAKMLYAEGIDPVTLIALRMLLSVPAFLLVALLTWRDAPRLQPMDLLKIAFLGLLGYYASSMLDFLGLQYITAGLERLILYLMPTFVLLIGIFVFGHSVSRRQWYSLAFAYAGVLLVFWHDVGLGGATVFLGGALVLGAAVLYAVYLLFSAELLKRVGTMRLTSLAMTVCAAACLGQYALLHPFGTLFEQSSEVWKLSLINASLCTVLPVFLTMIAVSRIGAGLASQASMVGPVSTLFLAWWLIGEPITGLQLAGTALVLTGVLLLSGRRNSAAVVTP